MKLHFETNIAEGTPEELVEYLRLVEEGNKDNQLLCFGYAHRPVEPEEAEEPSTELQVGDRVRVLESAHGAVGEATVTDVLKNGYVEIAGKGKYGDYLPNWCSHETFLEKIEEDVEVDPEDFEDGLLGYRYWYLEGTTFNKFVVLEASTDGYFEDSTGKRYTHQAVSGYAKPIDREDAYVKFDDAEHEGSLLKYYPTLDMFDAE